ncbi:MAG: hypothetical protein WA843_00520 [Candidatus Saccharimonadales bacterium]
MSELVRTPEGEQAYVIIAQGLQYWLMKEVGSSTVDHNKVLDEFDRFRADLLLPYEDNRNTNASKNRSHFSQYIDWTNGFAEHYDKFDAEQKDYATARQMFRPQMYLSGLFRVQCMMQARDQGDYYRRRLEGDYTGVALDSIVDWRLRELLGVTPAPEKFKSPNMTLEELTTQTLTMNERQHEYGKALHRTGHLNAGKVTSPTIDSIFVLQRDWTNLITDYIVFAAAERDGKLAAVPFLAPKSITQNPGVYYPFADQS